MPALTTLKALGIACALLVATSVSPVQAVILESDEPGTEWLVSTEWTPSICQESDGDFAEQVFRWCPLIAKHFPRQYVHWALHIVTCESQGREWAKNSRSSASGLFQFIRGTWRLVQNRNPGWPGFEEARFNPEWNIRFTAWLLRADGSGTRNWSCNPKARHAL